MKFEYYLNKAATYAKVYRIPVRRVTGPVDYWSGTGKSWCRSTTFQSPKGVRQGIPALDEEVRMVPIAPERAQREGAKL